MSKIVHSIEPFNAEPPLSLLRAALRTPQEVFYVRSHGPIPQVDPTRHRVAIAGLVSHPRAMSVSMLRNSFPTRTIEAVIQCAGNRRADLLAVRKVLGDPWAAGAIGNATWTGVALRDVLLASQITEGARHIAFTALDTVRDAPYAVSVPVEKALSPEVLLAWAMNGEPLTSEHGAPLRVVAPGYAGVRSAKWLAVIEARAEPAQGHTQRDDYKLFPSDVTEADADPAHALTIDEMPLNAAICEPEHGARLSAGTVRVQGYAVAGERTVSRVEVSADGGRRWIQADLQGGTKWSWVFWQASLGLPSGDHDLVARAWDSAGQTQPATADQVWNFKGYLCNAWHRISVTVAPPHRLPAGDGT